MVMVQRVYNPAARRLAIERQLLLDGSVTVDTLARDLDVSVATIRRDLTQLEDDGLIRRTHGGAVFQAPRGADQAFGIREQIDSEAKGRIARAACQLVEADQTILMNDGSTLLALARELVARDIPLTIVTPGVNIASCLSENPRISAYLLGGRVRHQTLGTSGSFAERMLGDFNADIAFLAAEGTTVREGLTYSYETDSALARLMHERAATTVVLATTRKLKQRDRITALPVTSIDMLVTECDEPVLLEPFTRLGIAIVPAATPRPETDNVAWPMSS
jgi:DeoR/GlpR family transcriptional regulator of sugar metabolism